MFEVWGKSFCGVTADLEVLFERFEILASLVFLEPAKEKDVEASLGVPDRRNWIRIPLGRAAWDGSRRKVLEEELQSPEYRSSLLEAGFANGSARFLDLFIAAHARVCQAISPFGR